MTLRTSVAAALLALLAGVVAALAWRRAENPVASDTLAWIATAHQRGPVSYRDPAGAISPDGRWIAYSEGRFLRVRPAGGGAIVEFEPGGSQIRHLAWSPDSRTIAADGHTTPTSWAIYDRIAATHRPLWPERKDAGSLRQLAWSPDGRQVAAVSNGRDGAQLWTVAADGSSADAKTIGKPLTYPAWTPRGEIACVSTVDGRPRVTLPCGGAVLPAHPDRDAFGPLAFSPDAALAYVALANDAGTVDLWQIPTTNGGTARRLTSFSRDTYAPSAARDGSVVFKVQSYRTAVAVASAAGGPSRPLATFQSETPSWDSSGKWIGITYGTWRRIPDDARYPDIAQDAGIIAADSEELASAPAKIVHDSSSEDQSLCWSPNGEWIVFHSHKDQSDDLWIRRANGDTSARRMTMLGRGAEAGWPRWSSDGHWLTFTGASRTTHRPAIYVVGMDQQSGSVTADAREVLLQALDVDVFHSEWIDAGRTLAAIAKEEPGRHVIFTVPRDGGDPHIVHRFASEHDQPGLGVSPDGRQFAFVAPAPDGFFQIFALPIGGGTPRQVTTDASDKTQPAWSPDGGRIAFTVWSYEAQFWRINAARKD